MKQVDLSPSAPASVCRGWGAFFNPPLFVGTPLDREALNRQNNGCRAFVKALDTVYKGRQVIVSREGLVVLAEPQMLVAIELLNEIMVVLLLRSVPVNGVRERDLLECSVDMPHKEIAGGKWWDGGGNQAPLERNFEGFNARFYHPDNVRSYIRRAERMTGDPTTQAELRLLLEAFTSHQESAFAASFLLSWWGAARLLGAQGQSQVGQTGLDVDAVAHQEAERLREKHSRIVRYGEEVTIRESGSCFHFFLSQLRKKLASEEP